LAETSRNCPVEAGAVFENRSSNGSERFCTRIGRGARVRGIAVEEIRGGWFCLRMRRVKVPLHETITKVERERALDFDEWPYWPCYIHPRSDPPETQCIVGVYRLTLD